MPRNIRDITIVGLGLTLIYWLARGVVWLCS